MLVIVLENAPRRLHGYLTRLLVEVRAGVYVGDFSVKVRERLWEVVSEEIGEGNAVLVWSTNDDAGFAFDTCGVNRRVPVDLDGLRLVQFLREKPETIIRDSVDSPPGSAGVGPPRD